MDSKIGGGISPIGTESLLPIESGLILPVCQILWSAGPNRSCSRAKTACAMPGTRPTPMKSKIPAAMRSGSRTMSSYRTRWQRSGCFSSTSAIPWAWSCQYLPSAITALPGEPAMYWSNP